MKSYEELIADMTEVLSHVHSRAFELGYAQGKIDGMVAVIPKFNPDKVETPQQKRDRIVEQAKVNVEELVMNGFARNKYGDRRDVKFIVNPEKRTVVVLLSGPLSGLIYAKGIAKCAPTDCFNVHIGKAIALRRALGLEVPAEYYNAPQPTEVRVGDFVRLLNIESTVQGSMGQQAESLTRQVANGISKVIDDSRGGDAE